MVRVNVRIEMKGGTQGRDDFGERLKTKKL